MKVAVVGIGYWGPNVVRNLQIIDGCEQVVVYDPNEARTKTVLSQFPSAVAADSYEEILGDPDVRAVVIVTPVNSHYELATMALTAGKSVLVEKPLATKLAEAQALVDLATREGLLVMAGHTFLYSPAVMAIRELVRAGDIGTPLYLQSSRVNLGIHQSDVSVLWDLAPHDLSILLDWLDDQPVRVSASGRSSVLTAQPDVAFVDVAFASGFVANLHLSWLAPTKVRRMTLVGSSKMLVYEDTHPDEPVKIYDKGLNLPDPEDFEQYRMTYRTGDIVSPRVETWEPLRLELEEFLRRVTRGETPDVREDTAARIVAIIEAAEQSLTQYGAPVAL